jgi:hypothetical protein
MTIPRNGISEMGSAENRAKNQKMAADLVARGIFHGKRRAKGLSNIPSVTDTGSAAYRRLIEKGKGRKNV